MTAAAALLFFVYLGFEEIANLAEEVRNPGRDIPIALFVSLAVTTGLYVAVSFAVLSLTSPAELAASEAPLAAAVQKAWPSAANVLSAIALFATANTVLITVIATSRVAFSMARDKEISSVFAWLLPARQTVKLQQRQRSLSDRSKREARQHDSLTSSCEQFCTAFILVSAYIHQRESIVPWRKAARPFLF